QDSNQRIRDIQNTYFRLFKNTSGNTGTSGSQERDPLLQIQGGPASAGNVEVQSGATVRRRQRKPRPVSISNEDSVGGPGGGNETCRRPTPSAAAIGSAHLAASSDTHEPRGPHTHPHPRAEDRTDRA